MFVVLLCVLALLLCCCVRGWCVTVVCAAWCVGAPLGSIPRVSFCRSYLVVGKWRGAGQSGLFGMPASVPRVLRQGGVRAGLGVWLWVPSGVANAWCSRVLMSWPYGS